MFNYGFCAGCGLVDYNNVCSCDKFVVSVFFYHYIAQSKELLFERIACDGHLNHQCYCSNDEKFKTIPIFNAVCIKWLNPCYLHSACVFFFV